MAHTTTALLFLASALAVLAKLNHSATGAPNTINVRIRILPPPKNRTQPPAKPSSSPLSQQDVVRFAADALQLIRAKCRLDKSHHSSIQGLTSMARKALAKEINGPDTAHAHSTSQIDALITSMEKCSGADALDSSEESDGGEISLALSEAPPETTTERRPQWSTSVPPAIHEDDDGHVRAKESGLDLIGSVLKTDTDASEVRTTPERNATAVPMVRTLMDKLKDNAVTKWVKSTLKSLKYFFVDALKPRPALKRHKHTYFKRVDDDQLIRERRAGDSLHSSDLSKLLVMPFAKLFSPTITGQGVRTLKRFLNAALRVYTHTCSPSQGNVDALKTVATQALEQLTNNSHIVFAMNHLVDQRLVSAVDACER